MSKPFLRTPPFPGHRGRTLTQSGTNQFDPKAAFTALKTERVGGSFWANPARLKPGCDLVLVPDNAAQLALMQHHVREPGITVVLPPGMAAPLGLVSICGSFDPWTVAEQAREVWAGSNRELATVAALLGKPVRLFDDRHPICPQPDLLAELRQELAGQDYANPFTGDPWDLPSVIAQLGEWRRLIEANRDFHAIYGVALWKRVTIDPLLWDGTGPVRHAREVSRDLKPPTRVLAWKSRTPRRVLAELEKRGITVSELEDGFIRSIGLGANCVPPLSVIVDRSGIYFDPNQPSDLEAMLEYGELPDTWVKRSMALQAKLVQAGISKYGRERVEIAQTSPGRRRVLVTGQVEDDRSVLSGGGNCSNLELIARARQHEPEAWIIYKPHPDVEAGHRKGQVSATEALRHANAIEHKGAIAGLIESVDALQVITSLAGFEALLRGKSVTTHGQPFYAGWGLTNDLGPANPRRTRRRSLDELAAAALIGYPRYVDPVTRLPCPPEIVVARIARGEAAVSSPLVTLRQWQGRLALLWRGLTGRLA